MTHTVVALVRDHPAVLNRTVSLIRRRGYNIDHLVVARSDQPGFSRVSVAVEADNVTHIVEQLRRLIDVITVESYTQSFHWQGDGADHHVED